MDGLFEQIKGIADVQNKAIMSGVELGRNESAGRIRELETDNIRLVNVLRDAREAINTLPIDALGEGEVIQRDGTLLVWPLRDELINRITMAIEGE